MFITMAAILELEGFPSLQSLRRYTTSGFDREEELKAAQWLFDGMSEEEASKAQNTRVLKQGPDEWARLKRLRLHEDEARTQRQQPGGGGARARL